MRASTIWRILDRDTRKPWQHQRWLYPRDPCFAAKAGRVLERYAGWWDGAPLASDDWISSADEQTSIQARVRCHATTPPLPGQPMRVEHEYGRGGALAGCPLGAGRLGCPPGRPGALRAGALRREDRDPGLRAVGRSGAATGALAQRPPRLLGGRQRQQPSGRRRLPAAASAASAPHPRPSADPRLVAQPIPRHMMRYTCLHLAWQAPILPPT